MLLGIVSDSHDHLTHLELALRRFEREGVERVLHPGDIIAPFAAKLLKEMWKGPLRIIYGNNDGERRGLASVFPEITDGPVLVEWGGRRISMDHYPPDEQHRPIENCEVILFGHIHQVVQENKAGTLILNPGESCGWVTGRPTVALLDTVNLKAEIVEIKS